jgi:hypothetical protein
MPIARNDQNGPRPHSGNIRKGNCERFMAEQMRGSRVPVKIDSCDEQVCRDDQIATRQLADDGSVIADAGQDSR